MNKKALLRFVFLLLSLTTVSVALATEVLAACDENSSTGDCLRELSKILPHDESLKEKAMTLNESNRENTQHHLDNHTPSATARNIQVAKFSGSLNSNKKASNLFVVCESDSNETVLYMEWHYPVASFGTLLPLTYQVDQQTTESTEVIALSEAVGETQFLEPMPIVKKLLNANRFSISMVNASGETLTALFDTKQAAKALANVRQACHW